MKTKDITAPVIAMVIVMAIVGAGAVYILTSGEPETDPSPVELGPITQRMSSLTTTLSSERGSIPIDEFQEEMEGRLSTWVSNSNPLVPGYSVELESHDVVVTESLLSLDIPLPSSAMERSDGTLMPDHRMFGSSGSRSMVPSVRTDVVLTLALDPQNGGYLRYEVISYSTETVDPERALSSLLNMLEDDTSSWYSRFARDMEYILTSLVRLRAANGVGTEFSDSYLNLLNGGDVELAANFALASALTRYTGKVPPNLASSIDEHFSRLQLKPVMNPSGNRLWGTSETENYRDYMTLSRNSPQRRTAEDLLSLQNTFGHSDTADLFLRYLYLDRTGKTLGRTEALDFQSTLKESQLLNPRQPTDEFDPYSLEHHPSFPSYQGMDVMSSRSLLSGNRTLGTIKPTFDTEFLVLGKDLLVKGIHDYNAWYTNANLSLSDEDLIATGNGSQINPTRCGAIPPPPQPPNHDYRIQWDLDIQGTFEVSADSVGWSGNTYDPSKIQRTINFSFPARIYSGTGTLVDEGFEGHLRNINTGKQFYTPISTGWLITPIANATEYFESRTWPELKNAFGALTSLARSSGWADENLQALESRQSIHASSMAALSSLESWMENSDAREDLHIFHNNKIRIPGIDINDLGPLRIDGHQLHFGYSLARDRMEIKSDLPQGRLSIILGPISGGDLKVEAEVELWSGTRIELDIDDGTFSLHGNFDGYNVNEGSKIPKQPIDTLLTTLSMSSISSPEMKVEIPDRPSPYISPEDIPDMSDLEVYASVVLLGDETNDLMDEVPDTYGHGVKTLFERLVPLADDNRLSIGIRIRFEGSTLPSLSRSVVFTSLNADDLRGLERMNLIDQIILDTIMGARIRIPGVIGEEVLLLEETPAWSLHVPGGFTQGYVMTAVHVSPLGQATFSYFASEDPASAVDNWIVQPGETPSPLW